MEPGRTLSVSQVNAYLACPLKYRFQYVEVAAAIETEHFFPNPSWRCTECEYFAHCQQWRGTWPLPSEQLVTVSDGEGVGESAGA